MSQNVASSTPPELATDGKSETKAQVSKSTHTAIESEKLRAHFPEHLRFFLTPPVPLETPEWRIFFGTIILFLKLIDVSNPIGLIFLPDIALAVVESRRLVRLREQIIDNAKYSILRDQIEDGLRRERRPEHEIAINAASLARGYFEDRSQRREIIDRFYVLDESELEAAAFRVRLLDLGRIEQMQKSCEQRRDRALKNLYSLRKEEVQRLREVAQRLENNADVNPLADEEIVTSAGN
jgi:hypothetical protein